MNQNLSSADIKKYNLTIWKVLILGIALFAIFIIAIGFGVFGTLPSFRDIEHPKSNQATEIVAEDGKVMGTYFVQNRSNVYLSGNFPQCHQCLDLYRRYPFYGTFGY